MVVIEMNLGEPRSRSPQSHRFSHRQNRAQRPLAISSTRSATTSRARGGFERPSDYVVADSAVCLRGFPAGRPTLTTRDEGVGRSHGLGQPSKSCEDVRHSLGWAVGLGGDGKPGVGMESRRPGYTSAGHQAKLQRAEYRGLFHPHALRAALTVDDIFNITVDRGS
jgi:hypothetical protein